jgi:hypothetical protein
MLLQKINGIIRRCIVGNDNPGPGRAVFDNGGQELLEKGFTVPVQDYNGHPGVYHTGKIFSRQAFQGPALVKVRFFGHRGSNKFS